MYYTWDKEKNQANQKKHGVRFEDVIPMFEAGSFDVKYDEENSSHGEDRFIAEGYLSSLGFVIVVFVEVVEDTIRIISARKA